MAYPAWGADHQLEERVNKKLKKLKEQLDILDKAMTSVAARVKELEMKDYELGDRAGDVCGETETGDVRLV